MASNFQQQARQRKLVYAALILVLFTAAFAWRQYSVNAQAAALAIREQSRGEVELSGAVVRLSLTGLRGLATCVLWDAAQEQQKKNQWNELEVTVRSVAKLQPHFITPWLFQSWNLAYNVSVESDRVNDKYFYITRGIEFLAEGERQNRDNPDLRWSIGFYNMHKITQSDETNVLRSLYQMSYVPPTERDPARFWGKDDKQKVNLAEFEKFCRKHPQLVRRLKQGIRRETEQARKQQFTCATPEAVVRFLADNQRVPSVYEETAPAPVGGWQEKKDRMRKEFDPDRFPVLPPPPRDPRTGASRAPSPQHPFERETLTSAIEMRDEDDAHAVSLAWFAYAQEPVPDPDDMPGGTLPVEDRAHQRKPRYMMTVIFRQYPAQAARYMAERLQDEGWFDETGWDIGWPRGSTEWFPENRFADGSRAQVGAGRPWSKDAWQMAFDMWRTHGEKNHLLPSKEDLNRHEELAAKFRKKFQLEEGAPVPPLREESLDPETKEQYHAYRFLRELGTHRQVSNFLHHYYRSLVEQDPVTVQARKMFYEAEALRVAGSFGDALARYDDPRALRAWRKILEEKKDFRQDDFNQEEAFEVQLRYQDLVNEVKGGWVKEKPLYWQCPRLLPALLPATGAGAVPVGFVGWLSPMIPTKAEDPEKPAAWSDPLVGGPFDGTDAAGSPLIQPHARAQVLQRRQALTPGQRPAGPQGGPGQQRGSAGPGR